MALRSVPLSVLRSVPLSVLRSAPPLVQPSARELWLRRVLTSLVVWRRHRRRLLRCLMSVWGHVSRRATVLA